VPRVGLEPTRLAAPDFESGASTSSTTPATGKTISIPAMELSGISLTRGDRPVFTGLDLSLTEPRIGLIGVNGAGKSSLLRLIKGLLKPDSGQVVTKGSPGFVFQNPDHQLLFPTVMEELCFGLLEQGVTPQECQARAESLLNRYDASHLQTLAVHELSDGQKQLLCILSVLMDEPREILLDEPFSSLDHPTTQGLMTLIQELDQQILMATHHLALVREFDRVIWLHEGQVRQDGQPAAVIRDYEQFFARHPKRRSQPSASPAPLSA
jgi:biotin transport system ATP-binding protein